MAREYANPDALVSTEWVEQHRNDPNVRVVEVDVDTELYEKGHVPGAVAWNWTTELNDPVARDIVSKDAFETLLGRSGVTPDTTVVLYGDNNNWFAAFAAWILEYYGHEKVKLVNGGRKKLEAEGRAFTTDVPQVTPTTYRVEKVREELRATRHEVLEAARERNRALVDVRSPDEFTGRILAPPGMSETALRGGHVPGAVNVPWAKAVNEDGTFKAAGDLESLYGPVVDAPEAITYCRIGERSSHTWFALKHLVGVPNVRNYDGSWTEYGNLIGAPIEKGEARK